MAELVMYVDGNFGGLHTHVFENTVGGGVSDFTQLALGGVGSGISGNWNDKVSSFVIVSGRWQFFKDINYSPAPLPFASGLGPGLYPNVESVGIDNDSLSSVKCIGL
jgi:hypothetical protein